MNRGRIERMRRIHADFLLVDPRESAASAKSAVY
jgi:hypothetical protein